MELTLQLGIVAAFVQAVAFALYNKNIFSGATEPNTSTWSLWTFLTLLNASTYWLMTADLAKYALPVTSAIATIGTFCFSLAIGRFKKIRAWDWLVVAIGVAAGIIWKRYESVMLGNFIVVGAVAIAFIPLYRDVWKNAALEKPLPWYLWTIAYGILTLVVVLRWRDQYQDLVYPVSMFFLHLAVGLMTLRKTPRSVERNSNRGRSAWTRN